MCDWVIWIVWFSDWLNQRFLFDWSIDSLTLFIVFQFSDWFIQRLIDWLIDWSIVWLYSLFFDSLIDLFKDWLIDWLYSLFDLLIYWLIDGLTYSLIDTVINLFIGELKERVSKLTYPTLQHCLRMLYTMNGNSKH